jgi:hypothetical protein
LSSTLVESSVAVCAQRSELIVPPEGQVAAVPEAGIVKTCVEPRNDVPLLPPVMSTLPFASLVAVCPSREDERAVVVDQVSALVSKSWTVAKLVVPPEFPPTINTLLLKLLLLLVSKVAVWDRRAEDILNDWRVQAPEPVVGL